MVSAPSLPSRGTEWHGDPGATHSRSHTRSPRCSQGSRSSGGVSVRARTTISASPPVRKCADTRSHAPSTDSSPVSSRPLRSAASAEGATSTASSCRATGVAGATSLLGG